ncbi:hypothetical protein [Actinocorallia populi]|uniref:hypothetical protein n=1 Tax=Actinocorallia populi TaxID=2079200 RepID=UPI000D093079|nr:hypothetical protein [Actinocorallia populi]
MEHGFREGLWLDGWDQQSVWGYDEGMVSYFAQLWRNGDNGDAPTIWISGMNPRYEYPERLLGAIVAATRAPALEVFRAMQRPDAAPAGNSPARSLPRHPIPTKAELQRQYASASSSDDPYPGGVADALAWLLGIGQSTAGPVTGQHASIPPTEEEIDAERWAASAAVHQRSDHPQSWFVGVEGTLMWARGQMDEPL